MGAAKATPEAEQRGADKRFHEANRHFVDWVLEEARMSIFNTPAGPRSPFGPHSFVEAAIFGAGLFAAIVVGVIASSMVTF